MKAKNLFTSVLAAACAFSIAACGSTGTTEKADDKKESPATGTVRVWFMEGSVSDGAQQALKEEFEKRNPGSELKIEIQQWDGIISKLQTSLASKNESPDIVEIGNTQTATFSTVGAFAEVTDLKDSLGGTDLIPSFVEASTVDGKIFALPLYAGARGVYYRTDLFEKAGLKVPETIEEFKDTVIKLQEANPDGVADFGGLYLAAVDVHGVESFLFSAGFDYATYEDGKWVAKVSAPESIEALKMAQEIFKKGSIWGLDSQASQKQFFRYFNENQAGMLIGTGSIGVRMDEQLWKDNKVGVFKMPSKVKGTPGASFAGGSNIALAANSQNPELAKKALEVIFDEKFQKQIAADGWVPGNLKYGSEISGPLGGIAADIVNNSKLTPNTPQWGVAVGDGKLNEFFTRIAKGEDVEAVAKAFNDELESTLNAK